MATFMQGLVYASISNTNGRNNSGNTTIHADDRSWHQGHQCHEIKEEHVPLLLDHAIADYQAANLFAQLFKRGPVVQLLEDDVDPK